MTSGGAFQLRADASFSDQSAAGDADVNAAQSDDDKESFQESRSPKGQDQPVVARYSKYGAQMKIVRFTKSQK